MTLLPRHTRATPPEPEPADDAQIVLEWHTGAMATVETFQIPVPTEHYADLFEKALRAAGTTRVVWFRVDDTGESA